MNTHISVNEVANYILEKASNNKINAEKICRSQFGDEILRGNTLRVALSLLEEHGLIRRLHSNNRVVDLTGKGKEIIENQSSFLKYLSSLEHEAYQAVENEERDKNRDRRPMWVAAGISLFGVIAAVCINVYNIKS